MRWSPIVELRQYTLHPGKRDELIDLFEAEFVETQESAGMSVIGTFRDLDDPDRFVWLRGFPTMESRADSLAAFYGGPVWRRHRDAANATMIDSDDVLLLRPATACAGCAPASERSAGSAAVDWGIVEALLLTLRVPATTEAAARLTDEVATRVTAAGGSPLASFVSEESENTYPALPVRAGEHVFVAFAGYPSREHCTSHAPWGEIARSADAQATDSHRVLRLLPTRRSLLTGTQPSQ
jgi:NIPSNAP protein